MSPIEAPRAKGGPRQAIASSVHIRFFRGSTIVLSTRILALLVTLLLSWSALASELRLAQLPVPGRYIVVLKDIQDLPAQYQRGSAASVQAAAAELAATFGVKVERTYEHALRGFVVDGAKRSTIEALMKDPRVAYVEEDGEVWALQTTQPNATWGLDRIDQRDLPLNGTYTYSTTASNVRAYIIDTGIRSTHSEFGGRVLSGYTAINDGRGSEDCNGHGTHVAGTVGGATYGVAKQVRLVPVRVLNCQGSGTNSGVIAGIDWVTANHVKPAVANMSLGGGASSAVDTAVNNLINAGVTVVVAAGNENQDACNVSPARVANAITVGSTTNTDARSSFSNWGSCVNIFAPGSNITAAWHTSNTATNTISGTSMASPHVAGVAALYLAANPSATPATARNAIYSTASQGKLSGIGTGSPNLLVYSLLTSNGGGGGGGGGGGTGSTPLNKGQTVTISGAAGSETRFHFTVPSGATNLVVSMSGGTGDADLYVRFGQAPTTSAYDCRPYRSDSNETCSFASPQAGTWHIMVRGYSAYSNVSLSVNWTDPAGGGGGGGGNAPCTGCTKYSGSLAGTGSAQIQPNGSYYQTTTSGRHEAWLRGPSNADFDLELYRWNGSSWTRVARSAGSTSNEYISYNGTAGYYYWRVISYRGSGAYDLWIKRPQ